MDSALSIWFLLLWLAGDSCNLIGSFLADQLPLQTYTAVYYVCADLVMLSMYGYYSLRHKVGTGDNQLILLLLSQKKKIQAFSAVQPFTTKEIIGFTIGSASSLLYLCSRLPQMYMNEIYRRRVVLPVCAGDSGKHHVRPERAAEEPGARAGRGQLHHPPPALAHRQPGDALPRPPDALYVCVYIVVSIS
uniref:Solute carrier family 66 member 1 n=1 Tax=Astyanax mexicanus TaxID=7994 RepID=A0A8B9HBL4_ASTMX